MSSLVERLKKIQVHQAEALPDVTKYSLEELDRMKVEFGTKHMGRTFKEVWDTDQQWVAWFLKHYQASTEGVHRLMIQYIEMRVDRAELEGQTVPVTEPEPQVTKGKSSKELGKLSLGMVPKAKAAPWFMPEVDEMSVWDNDVASQASLPIEQPEVSPQLEHRMQAMEGAIQSILHHLETMAIQQGPVRESGHVDQ